MGVLQSSLLQGLLLLLMLLVIHVQIRHPSKDLACHPGLVLPLKIVVVSSDASSDLSHCSRLSKERYYDPFVPSARYSDNRRLRSRESPSPKQVGVASRGSPSPQRMGFASRGSPSPKQMGFASRGSPSPQRMGFASRGSPSPKRMGFASRGSPSPQRQCFASRDSASPRHQHSSRASSGDNPFERPHSRSSPTSPSSPSKDDKEADESSLTAPVKAMIDFILKSFPDAQESPSHPSSRSFDLCLCRSYRRCDSLGIAFGLVPCDVRCLL